MSKGNKLELEETQVDEVTEFVSDEAPDRVNIRRDPLFDDVKIKAFHRRHHQLLKPPHRRQPQQQQQQQQQHGGKKLSPINKAPEKGKEKNESAGNVSEEKGSHMAENNNVIRSEKEQLNSTEITFSHQTQLHSL
ncbi:unnamed protein product [Cercopithifilaria johnstoni]|uniref:Uncharacterized protein n=1 Tax=Cercopithifilaria johnstoni TaxID=2874296 RepID=A0A8J2Q7B8_9BILA|nr:unnamed protein product [Cercopithifilaria johnstoni]